MLFARLEPILRLIRVEQWYKNVLIAVPAVFSLKLLDAGTYPSLLAGFLSLSLSSSAGYVFNDIMDVERDKLHPRKRYRPLPSGQVSIRAAYLLALALAIISLSLANLLGVLFASHVAALILVTCAYSLYLKNVPVVDVTAIAVNYLIRAVSGAVLIEVEVSPWLIAGVFFLALFLALSKRKAELRIAGSESREILESYEVKWLDQALNMCAAMVMVTYAIYCAEVPLGHKLVPTIPLVAFFLLRYMLALELGRGEQPHEIVLGDKLSLLAALVLIFSVLALVYAWP